MTRRTKKVGIVGKYATRYGASIRKRIKQYEISQHASYVDPFTGKVRSSILRQAPLRYSANDVFRTVRRSGAAAGVEFQR